MREASANVRELVLNGATLSEIVAALREDETFILTPFNFLRVFQEALGMTLNESLVLLEVFDPEMQPFSSAEDVDRHGKTILQRYRLNGG